MRARYCWLPRLVRGKARHEEVEAWEGHHVDGQLAEVSVDWPGRRQVVTPLMVAEVVVQVSVGWRGQLEGAETYVVRASLSMQ